MRKGLGQSGSLSGLDANTGLPPMPIDPPAPEKKLDGIPTAAKPSGLTTTPGGVIYIGSVKDFWKQKDPSKLKEAPTAPMMSQKLEPDQQKPFKNLRSVAVGNMPPGVPLDVFQSFLHRILVKSGATFERVPGPIILAVAPVTGGTVFVELRSIEEAMASLELDGVLFAGKNLTFKRNIENPRLAQTTGSRPVPKPNENYLRKLKVSPSVKDDTEKLKLTGFPSNVAEDHLAIALSEIGPLNELLLRREQTTFASKCLAFCRFASPEATRAALKAKILIEGKPVKVERVYEVAEKKEAPLMGLLSNQLAASKKKKSVSKSSDSSSSSSKSDSSSSSGSSSSAGPSEEKRKVFVDPKKLRVIVGEKVVQIDIAEPCKLF